MMTMTQMGGTPPRTMGPSDSLIQHSLVNTQFSANTEEELLAPLFKTAPPSPATWRRSDIVTVQNWHVCGVAGQDAAIVSSSCQIQQFLTTQKVPAIQDDDFLVLIFSAQFSPHKVS